MTEAKVSLRSVTKRFGKVEAVRDVTLDVRDGEFLILLGPSGCGKSTLLNMVAGLEDATSGDMFIGGTRVNDLAPRARNISMVFQSYALFPHMTVFDNIAFPLRMFGHGRRDIAPRVTEVAELLRIGRLLERRPGELSGGERQRVAIGRAIARTPGVFLLDEPLSNLDAKLRIYMRAELVRLHRALETTSVYVTHDQEEAMTMGDRLAVMKEGVLQQIGTVEEVYGFPANRFVGEFIGNPAMNFLEGVLERRDGALVFVVGDGSLTLRMPASLVRASGGDGQRGFTLGVRPEFVVVGDRDEEDAVKFGVQLRQMVGDRSIVYLERGGTVVIAYAPNSFRGEEAYVRFLPSGFRFFDGATNVAMKGVG